MITGARAFAAFTTLINLRWSVISNGLSHEDQENTLWPLDVMSQVTGCRSDDADGNCEFSFQWPDRATGTSLADSHNKFSNLLVLEV